MVCWHVASLSTNLKFCGIKLRFYKDSHFFLGLPTPLDFISNEKKSKYDPFKDTYF